MDKLADRKSLDILSEENQRLQRRARTIIERFIEKSAVERDGQASSQDDFSIIEDYIAKLKAELNQYRWIEDELKSELVHLKHHLENVQSFAIYQLVVDPSNETFRVSFVSRSFREIMGVEDPMDHDTWVKAVHPDDLERILAAHQRAFQDTHRFEEILRMYHSGRKEWRWYQFLATAVSEMDGKPKWVNGIVIDLTEHKRADLKLLEYQKRLQDLSQKQFAGEERERRRVAEVLHDEVGQELTLALFKMNQARERQAGLGTLVDELAPLLEQAIAYTRSLTKELCPPALCQMGLADGLEWLVQRNQEQYGIDTRLDLDADLSGLDADLGVVRFRIVAELLNNVAKHSEAAHAWVKLKEGDGVIRIEVGDDGVGFDYTPEALQANDGFGLFMISERLRSVGGEFKIKSEQNAGTILAFKIPSG